MHFSSFLFSATYPITFIIRYLFTELINNERVREANEEILESINEYWIEFYNKKVSESPVRAWASGHFLGIGNIGIFDLKSQLDFLDSFTSDYSGNFVKHLFTPLEEANKEFGRGIP